MTDKTMGKDIERYKQAICKNPNDAKAHGNLGATYYMLGRNQEAIKEIKQCILLNPEFPAVVHHYLGNAYWRLNRYKEAIKAYKQSIAIDSPKLGYDNAYHDLGLVYYTLKRYQEAIEAFKQTIRIDPDNGAYCDLGKTYSKLKRWSESVEVYKTHCRGFLDYNNLGNAYGKLGRWSEAAEAYEQAIRINPNKARTHLALGMAYFGLRRRDEALRILGQPALIDSNILDECRTSEPIPSKALYNSTLYPTRHDIEREHENTIIISAYKQVIATKLTSAIAHCCLGLSYFLDGNFAEGLYQCEILKNLDKNLANKLRNLIDSSGTEKSEKKRSIQQPVQPSIIQETKMKKDDTQLSGLDKLEKREGGRIIDCVSKTITEKNGKRRRMTQAEYDIYVTGEDKYFWDKKMSMGDIIVHLVVACIWCFFGLSILVAIFAISYAIHPILSIPALIAGIYGEYKIWGNYGDDLMS